MKALTAAAIAFFPSLALAHPGHGAPVFHSHAWEIGLGLVAVIVVAGLVIRTCGREK
jgi:hypothetical protein